MPPYAIPFGTTRASPFALTGVLAAAFLLALATLGRGGSAGWAEGLILLAGALGFLTAALAKVQLSRPLLTAGLLWLLLASWCGVQSLSLPAFAHPIWAQAAAVLPAVTHRSIALDPYAAQSDGLRLLAYAGFLMLGYALATLGRQVLAVQAIAVGIIIFAIGGLVLVPETAEPVLGKVRHAADASFPFTSRNTFCAFAGVGLVIAAAHLAAGHRRARWFWLAVLTVSGAAVIASHSRAGLGAVALGAVTAAILARPTGRSLLLAITAAAVLTAAAAVTLTGIRLTQLPADIGIRAAIWRATASIAADHLWLGLGSLDQALQMQPGDWGDRHILRAHNIYLQSVAERGLPATLAALAALALLLWHIVRPMALAAATPQSRTLPAAALGTAALFASHGLVDFSLYAPSNAAILALMLGLASGSPPPALPRRQGFATNAQPSHF